MYFLTCVWRTEHITSMFPGKLYLNFTKTRETRIDTLSILTLICFSISFKQQRQQYTTWTDYIYNSTFYSIHLHQMCLNSSLPRTLCSGSVSSSRVRRPPPCCWAGQQGRKCRMQPSVAADWVNRTSSHNIINITTLHRLFWPQYSQTLPLPLCHIHSVPCSIFKTPCSVI